ncbi:formimidoylglutamate deiminase [Brevundimonas sp. SORGH_AS_0993]|uniref:formimidoylglutamate deiminase n=1 Tax=Brevundimonas sp. SORGH_AS_0993 TaxID=3041794 RepID=UPI00277DD373|nr:formimidoylglutamate deiminase [Brevundimonas sp. SORGH_AS_0993]MDQ1153668.1 formimidoylglutamate deiminase [Brevundimonas sp. SORGH_AS_0993]
MTLEPQPVDRTLWFEAALTPDGWARDVRLSVGGGRIVGLETGAARGAADQGGGVALPGVANVHSHAFQRAMAGLTEARGPSEDDFWTWRELMYRFLDRGGPEEIEAITALAFIEMLEGGFTRVAEFHYLHNDPAGAAYADRAEIAGRIAAAAQAAGIALTLLPVFYAHAGFGGQPPSHGQRRFISDLDGFADLVSRCRALTGDLSDAVVGVAPHSLRAVSPEELAMLPALAGDGPIHIHVAEQTKEVEDCRAWSGARPVEWLLTHAPVDTRWCLIHATHVTEAEWRGIADRGAVVGLCPITEANLGDGVFPAADYLHAGGRFGVGTDSNVQIGVAEELRLLEYSQRLARRGRAVMADSARSTGRALFERALAGGAQAAGAAGGLAVGAPADIVVLDTRGIAFAGRSGDAILDSWIFGAPGGAVGSVWRAGREVVRNGRHVARDAIEDRYRRALATVLG